ncbi:MAG: PKD domain-containing protein [Planctomycetales bacterium]|nr:PKD domain-containing protein [bacterium]UNM09819.1 MAG: PKD domain-containing protein [Planctomycetales bacterium]
MRRLSGSSRWILLACLLLLTVGCAGGGGQNTEQQAALQQPPAADPQLLAELEGLLMDELARLGKDPQRTTSAPPAGNGNAVFNLLVDARPPDGLGGQGDSEFRFYPRMVGDYDGNGEVGISDITPLGQYFGESVVYDDPLEHGGIAYWPSGEPDGGGRTNWLKARVDGDGNGEINTADITPIAIHFGEHCDGWRIERRFAAETGFEMLPHADNPESELSVGWKELAENSIGYRLPGDWPASGYLEMRVQGWESASSSGGPMSDSSIYEFTEGSCEAFLQASPTVADFPFDASFTAAGSSVLADSYVIDFGDGTDATLGSLAEFPLSHPYNEAGIYDVVFTVSCGTDVATDSFQIIATPLPCELEAVLGVNPMDGFAPLKVLFSPLGTSPGAAGYELDFGDGSEVASGATPSELAITHEYTETGSYTATLRVVCENGGNVETTVTITVGNPDDECGVNLSVDDDSPIIGTPTAFFFGGTSGSAALLDPGDGSDVQFINLQGPEPVFYTYPEIGTYTAVLSILCNDSMHSDSVLVFVLPEPINTFDAAGKVYQYESNPPIGGPEPDKFAMVGAEMEIYNSTDDVVMGTTTTDASGAYFFDGDSLGLDVNKIYFVRPTDAERAKHVPLDWFPGQATIAAPPADMVYTCTDINLLATEV